MKKSLFLTTLLLILFNFNLSAQCNAPATVSATQLSPLTYNVSWSSVPEADFFQVILKIHRCNSIETWSDFVNVTGNSVTHTIATPPFPANDWDFAEIFVISICGNSGSAPSLSQIIDINNCSCDDPYVLVLCPWLDEPNCQNCELLCLQKMTDNGLVDSDHDLVTWPLPFGNSFGNDGCVPITDFPSGTVFQAEVTYNGNCTQTINFTLECDDDPNPNCSDPYLIVPCPWMSGDLTCDNCNLLCIQQDNGNGTTGPATYENVSWPLPVGNSFGSGGCVSLLEYATGTLFQAVVSYTENGNNCTQTINYELDCSDLFTGNDNEFKASAINPIFGSDIETSISFDLYPTPAKDQLNISNHLSTDIYVNIYDLNGKLRSNIAMQGYGQSSLDISNLSSGLYIAKITSSIDNTEIVKKIIVSK